MIKHLFCAQHGVHMTVDDVALSRNVILEPGKDSATLCGLMLAAQPSAGQLPIVDEYGRVTAYVCTVVEVG